MSDEAQTKPTIETILERIDRLSTELRSEIQAFREESEIRLDRIESMVNQTRAEMLTLRADFREVRVQLRQPA
jgi:hypothetical protein